MNNGLHLSFQVKFSKKNKSGKVPIYVRLTVNDVRTEFSIKRYIEPEKWIIKAEIGKSTQIDPRSPLKSDPLSPEQTDPLWPA